jgi:hypothetical protein
MNEKQKLDQSDVVRATIHVRGMTRKCLIFLLDKNRESRLKAKECRYCHYLRGFTAGQTFAIVECARCGAEVACDTSSPKLCYGCAAKLNLCRWCGSDLGEDDGRMVEALPKKIITVEKRP